MDEELFEGSGLHNNTLGCECPSTLCGGFHARAFIEQGITINPASPTNNTNTPLTFNDRANEYQVNQLYLSLERPVGDAVHWKLGGRVDLLFGTDYFFVTSTGLETHSDGSQRWNRSSGPRGAGTAAAPMYGLALPQAYLEVQTPVTEGLSVKLGHFYSPLGYERVMATENFFYSHAYAFQYGLPLTHTGLLAEYSPANWHRVVLGATTGWNSFDSRRNQWGIIGGTELDIDSCTSLSFYFHTGEDGPPGVNSPAFFAGPDNANNVTAYSVILSRWLSERTQYVFQHSFGAEQDGSLAGGTLDAAKWYGINQYVLHDVNDCWSIGLRFEWFRDQDNSRVVDLATSGFGVSGGNFYGVTAGANWTPFRDVVIRSELRWDNSDVESPGIGLGGPFDDLTDDHQITLGLDVILHL